MKYVCGFNKENDFLAGCLYKDETSLNRVKALNNQIKVVVVVDEEDFNLFAKGYKRGEDGKPIEPIQPVMPPMTEEEIQDELERGIEAWMNTVVAEKHYDSIDTCIARYTDSPNPKYAQEAKAVKDWNTAVWDKCWDILAEVKTGKRAVPTLEEVIAELPVLVW